MSRKAKTIRQDHEFLKMSRKSKPRKMSSKRKRKKIIKGIFGLNMRAYAYIFPDTQIRNISN